MADAIATGLAVEATKVVAKVVTTRAVKEITLVWGLEKNLVKLRKRLLDIQAFLEDVGNEMHAKDSKRVNRWLLQVKDVAYLADDLIDDYAYEMLRKFMESHINKSKFKKKCRNFFNTSTNPMLIRFKMSHRVSRILLKFDELDKEAKSIGLQQLARGKLLLHTNSYNENTDLYQMRKYAAARGSEFIGRKSDEEMLLKMILNPEVKEGDLPIIAIVGIGGLGKTTLARRVYELDVVDGHFNKKKAWICVSTKFNVERILKEMFEALTSSKCDLANTGAIIDKLRGEVKKNKFLLVLDDVWSDNSELWDSLKNELHNIGDLSGSLILMTTRSTEVALKARAFYSHKLQGLSETDGWDLLKLNIFTGTGTIPNSSYFEVVGKRIVVKCYGVPLAIKAIRGVLQSKMDLHDWEEIERNELWNLVQPTILPSLQLSYNYLHSVYVKQCFAYCAVFHKGSLMDEDELTSFTKNLKLAAQL